MLKKLIGRIGIGRFRLRLRPTPLLLKSPLSRFYPDRASRSNGSEKPRQIKNYDKKSRKRQENNDKIEV